MEQNKKYRSYNSLYGAYYDEYDEDIFIKKIKNLEYIIKNGIETNNELISEHEYYEFEFIGRYYK